MPSAEFQWNSLATFQWTLQLYLLEDWCSSSVWFNCLNNALLNSTFSLSLNEFNGRFWCYLIAARNLLNADCMRMQYNDVYKSKLNDVSTACLLPMWMLGNVPSELIENVKITKYCGYWIGWAISSVDDIFWIFNHLCLFTRSTSHCLRHRKQFRFECTRFTWTTQIWFNVVKIEWNRFDSIFYLNSTT